jgi:hypothetical protein
MSLVEVSYFLTRLFSLELWYIFHDELDLDGNGQLDQAELQAALSKAGVCYHYPWFLFLSTI